MSKNNELIPELRFPEFNKDGSWKTEPLGDVAEVYQPKTISQSDLSEDGFPVYGANGIIGFYHEYNHETKQIAIACRGSSCGTVNFTKPKSWITGNAMVVNVDQFNDIAKEFMFFQLHHANLDYLVSGSGQPQITGSIKKHEVLLPPRKGEQQKIASCLSSLDELLAAHNEKLDALKDHKKGLMQNLLTQEIRFTKADGSSFEQWKEVNFTDCCELIHGFQFRQEHFTEKGIPIIKIGSLIDNGGLTFKNATYVDEKRKDEFLKFKLEKGDILMALTGGTLGKVSKISKDYGILFQNYRVGKFEPKNNAIKDYIYFILQSTLVQDRVKSLVNEAAQPNFGKQDFDKIHFSIPSVEEQQKIASCLSALDELITAQSDKIEQLQQHKTGLMQGLFPKIES